MLAVMLMTIPLSCMVFLDHLSIHLSSPIFSMAIVFFTAVMSGLDPHNTRNVYMRGVPSRAQELVAWIDAEL
jgi:hypothetical protein